MALTTVGEVRRLGGINDEDAYRLWSLSGEAELDQWIEDEITLVSALLTTDAGSNYTQTSDTNLQARFRRAEAYRVLAELVEPLKVRRTLGVQFPYAFAEPSDRIAALIDQNFMGKYESLVGSYVSTDTAAAPHSAGVFVISTALDRETEVDCITDRNDLILSEANCGGWPR